MRIDEQGTELMGVVDSLRLLAVGAKRRCRGHLGIGGDVGGAPAVLSLGYAVDGPDVVIHVAEELFEHIAGRMVTFEVDGVEAGRPWSVVVEGVAQPDDVAVVCGAVPLPRVITPGVRIVRIRSQAIRGRHLGAAYAANASAS